MASLHRRLCNGMPFRRPQANSAISARLWTPQRCRWKGGQSALCSTVASTSVTPPGGAGKAVRLLVSLAPRGYWPLQIAGGISNNEGNKKQFINQFAAV